MFQLMGHKNVAVLNGGLPDWINNEYPIEIKRKNKKARGNFIAEYQSNKIIFTENVLKNHTNSTYFIADARSKERFLGIVPEPRKDVKSGHIPKSTNIPYTEVLNQNLVKTKEELQTVFKKYNLQDKKIIFSCGTGITAAILALAAEILSLDNYAIYDGSWTEWGTTNNLPIEI